MGRRGAVVRWGIGALALMAACGGERARPDGAPRETTGKAEPPAVAEACVPDEAPVQEIALAGVAASRQQEYSSLAWAGDWLLLLSEEKPRYDKQLFAIPRAEIEAALSGARKGPITPREVRVEEQANPAHKAFDGFEALVFDDAGREAWLIMESRVPCGTTGAYLVRGSLSEDAKVLTIRGEPSQRLESQTGIPNFGDEAITRWRGALYTLHEGNGYAHEQPSPACKTAPAPDALHNPKPVARRFGEDLSVRPTTPMTRVDYRLTDATLPDAQGRFWAIQYLYADPKKGSAPPPPDPITARWGQGATHAQRGHVERLVELQITDAGIVPSGRAPLPLQLEQAPRKWEGLARMGDRGFLMITDQFPRTILAFVPLRADRKTCPAPAVKGAP